MTEKEICGLFFYWACLSRKITLELRHNRNLKMRAIVKASAVVFTPSPTKTRNLPDRSKIVSRSANGVMSARTKSRVRDILFAWSSARNAATGGVYGLIEMTLTLPAEQRHDDRWIKRNMLNVFLNERRCDLGEFRYYWCAETQANGNIHFHILVDAYWEKGEVNLAWAKICQRAGYIASDVEITGNEVPCTRVDRVRDDSGFARYVSKYVSKDSTDRRLVDGRLWACSRQLAKLGPFAIELGKGEVEEILDSVDEENIRGGGSSPVVAVVGRGRDMIVGSIEKFRWAKAHWICLNVAKLYDRAWHEKMYEKDLPTMWWTFGDVKKEGKVSYEQVAVKVKGEKKVRRGRADDGGWKQADLWPSAPGQCATAAGW